MLKRLGVAYVQGLYIGEPKPQIEDIQSTIKEVIKNIILRADFLKDSLNFLGKIESLCTRGYTVTEDVPGTKIYEIIGKDENIRSVCVLNDHEQTVGLLTYNKIMKIFGGRYGFELNTRKKVCDFMHTDFLEVDAITSIEDVSKMALARKNHSRQA